MIDFVRRLFRLDFKGAVQKLNEDFTLGLRIDCELTDEERREANRQAYRRRKELERRRSERKLLYTAYHAAFNRWRTLELVAEQNVPQSAAGGFSDEYIYAVTRLDAAWQDVQDAENRIYEFEKERK